MKATMWTHADMQIFLSKDNDILGYGLDEKSLDRLNLIVPDSLYPAGTAKTVVVDNVYIRLQYDRENFEDKKSNLVSFELNDTAVSLYLKINSVIDKAIDAPKDKLVKIAEDEEDGTLCEGFCPMLKEHENSYLCVHCMNAHFCNVPF